jgi:hypothetical protein
MCLQNGMLCLFVICLPVFCLLTLGEINIFQNGISCLFVMCLPTGMLCLSVICLPVFCLLAFDQYFPRRNILICITSLSVHYNIYFFFSAWTTKLKIFRRGLPC